MFKGFDKVENLTHVYTSVEESLCGIRLDTKYKGHYLLSGKMEAITYWTRSIWTPDHKLVEHFISKTNSKTERPLCELFIDILSFVIDFCRSIIHFIAKLLFT